MDKWKEENKVGEIFLFKIYFFVVGVVIGEEKVNVFSKMYK